MEEKFAKPLEKPPLRGQVEEKGKCFCHKEGVWKRADAFYRYRDGSKMQNCKDCTTMHLDNYNPETFLWILKELDFPYIKDRWEAKLRAAEERGQALTSKTILGKYLSEMMLAQYSDLTYADSERINAERYTPEAEVVEKQEEYKQQLDEKFQNGEISEIEYKALQPLPREEPTKQELDYKQLAKVCDTNRPAAYQDNFQDNSAALDEMVGNPLAGTPFVSPALIVDPSTQLTPEDLGYLATKWGVMYKPQELYMLEKDYLEQTKDFDEDSIDQDTINAVKLVCKTYLKMNQALDLGDFDSYNKLSRTYDSLRKSAKLTAAQKKEVVENDVISSIGEFVAYCEKYGGAIPEYKIDADKDVVDTIITDMKDYTKALVTEDPTIVQQMENYVAKKNAILQRKIDESENGGMITDEDIQEWRKHQDHQIVMEEQEALRALEEQMGTFKKYEFEDDDEEEEDATDSE